MVWKYNVCRKVCGAACLMAGLALSTAVAAGDSDVGSDIEIADRLALEHNQSITAFDSRIEESSQQAEFIEGQWPEPMVEYMADVSAPWTPHTTTGHMVRVMQQVPLPGARSRQAAPARGGIEVARLGQVEAQADLLRELRRDALELARIEARLELIEDEIGLIDDALGVVDAVAPLEGGGYGDIYQLELAREAAVDRRSQLRADRRAQATSMAAQTGVNRERIEELEFTGALLEDWRTELPERDELVDWAQQTEPELSRLQAEADVAAAEVERVDERRRPWPTVMAGYSNMPPMFDMDGPRSQMFQLGVSIRLPIVGSQYDAEASQWQAASQAVEDDRNQARRQLTGRIDELVDDWESDHQRLQRHLQELLPLATDLAEQVLVGMEVGERTASDFLLALQQEIELEAEIIDLRTEQLQRLMEIQRLTGGAFGDDAPWAYPAMYGDQQ